MTSLEKISEVVGLTRGCAAGDQLITQALEGEVREIHFLWIYHGSFLGGYMTKNTHVLNQIFFFFPFFLDRINIHMGTIHIQSTHFITTTH